MHFLSSTGNRRQVPSTNAAEWCVDWFVHPTGPRPQNLRAPHKGAAEDPLPGIWRPLRCREGFTSQNEKDAALTQTCMHCPLPSGSYHPPSYTEYVEGEWRWKGCGGINFHCENDQKLKDSHPTSHYGLWFSNTCHFTHVWREENVLLRACCKVEEQWPLCRSKRWVMQPEMRTQPCTKCTTYGLL